MAGALVGGAFLSATLQVLLDRMASRPVLDFFKGQQLSSQLLKKLKTKMITINKVLDDADHKQHTDPYVKQWLDELKDVVYEAEDLLDEIASEIQRSKIEAESQTTLEKMQDSASFHNPFKTGKKEKLEEILGTLEDLVEQGLLGLGLTGGTGVKPSYQRTPTTSIPDDSGIYGRDADKEAIMKWVLSDHPNNTNNPDVLAIVGIGGLGKTTLAQHVYSDSRVRGHFDKKAWVCISEKFNVLKITKDIFEGFTESFSDTNNLDKLQSRLMEGLTEKKFLLVLDDVWSKDYQEWKNLLKPLIFGKKGSRILVTSRNQDVADCMKTSPTHQLQKLSDNDCWSLFEKHAFMGTDMSSAHPDLESIGRQIVEKCDGLPLAAKLLGGALRSERNPDKWKNIVKRDMLDVQKDSILPILELSYRFLPSHLKRCFAYCAVIPKDYEFEKEKLIRFWKAEGLLPQHKVNNVEIEEVEEVGEGCFDDLVSRSLIQKSTRSERFLMHDLINDLAKTISGEFCFRYGVDRSCQITERIRHLWLCHREVDISIFPIQHLRTILLGEWSEEVDDWCPTFTRSRVLCLFCNYLPDSIGNLIHLRYLDLSRSNIKKLPDTITSLCNLETLILRDCRWFVELPATIFKLINLSQLDIRGTNLEKMPPHMGKLKKLGELDYYIVGKESNCSIKELGPLKRLRGHLRIQKLRHVSQVQESAEASLKCKEKLKKLELIWNGDGSEDSLHERNVLEQLQPHTNIEQLSISGYAGTRFPDWVGDSSLSNVVELNLEGCRYCLSLPALGQLGSLKRLLIIGFDGIRVVGREFYGNSNKPPFGCLESLTFEGMPEWQEWVPYSNMNEGDEATAAFPLLRELRIENCPNLREIQPTHLPSLKTLQIRDCGSFVRFPLDLAPALEWLNIYGCPNLEFLAVAAELEHLKCLIIRDCPNLKEIQPTHLPSLTILCILGCDQLFSLPRAPALHTLTIGDYSHDLALGHRNSSHPPLEMVEQLMALELKTLSIEGSDSVTSFPLDLFPMLEYLEISGCPKLESLSAASQARPLQHCKSLALGRCPNLKRLLFMHNCPESIVVDFLRIFPNLSRLYLDSCWGELESFPPENMLLPPTLTSLQISGFPNLKSFDNTALQSLTCLGELTIHYCPKLQSIPKEVLPSSLRVNIYGCPLLQLGQDWPFNPYRASGSTISYTTSYL